MSISDVISMTLAILDQVEVRGRRNVIAMNRAMENLEAIQTALDGASNTATGTEAGEVGKPFGDGTGHSPEVAKPSGDETGHSPEGGKAQ